jgi:hypothetical protein
VTSSECAAAISASGAHDDVLAAAGLMKRLVGQVNVVTHAAGILVCLPRILERHETIEYISLGAGNTGKAFDLETTHRIAEFKFIRWQGGPESIRQNALFKDFYLLAQHQTSKRKCLYVLGTQYPLKFLNGGRSLSSVLSRHVALQNQFRAAYGSQYATVRDYYTQWRDAVVIEDLTKLVPELVEGGVGEVEDFE